MTKPNSHTQGWCTIWYMNFSEHISASADRGQCWAAVADVTTWPQWTKSMRSVEPLDSASLAVGNRYRVTQPGMPKLVWQVNELTEGQEFTWSSRSPGVRTVAYHRLSPNADGTTEISIGVAHSGPLAGLVAALTRKRTERYLKMEAAGLKAASETSLATDE
jgi:uncharacterized membrane protein